MWKIDDMLSEMESLEDDKWALKSKIEALEWELLTSRDEIQAAEEWNAELVGEIEAKK